MPSFGRRLLCFLALASISSSSTLDDDITEDSFLDAMGLIVKYGYPAEAHEMTTSDGYVLTMHRIPGLNGVKRVPVMVMHGMGGGSTDWLVSGPDNALAYYLADLGFDVWLANCRGNIYSRKHVQLNPDIDRQYWNFSWHEMGEYDLPTMIDYVAATTNQTSMHYIGHSQGTNVFFVMISKMPEYNSRFLTVHAMAPTPFMGDHSFRFDGNLLSITCDVLESRIGVIIGHSTVGSSMKCLLHHIQLAKRGKFVKYDYGIQGNMLEYGTHEPPDYDLSKTTAPVYLYYGTRDMVANRANVLHLNRSLVDSHGIVKVPSDVFGHFGFIWGKDARALVYRGIVEAIDAANDVE